MQDYFHIHGIVVTYSNGKVQSFNNCGFITVDSGDKTHKIDITEIEKIEFFDYKEPNHAEGCGH